MPASTSNALGSAAGLFSSAGSTSMGAPGAGVGVGGGIAASSSLSLNSLELDASNGHMGPSGVATSSAAAIPNGMTATTASGLDENSRLVFYFRPMDPWNHMCFCLTNNPWNT